MTRWAGVGHAYAASYASLCAGTNDALIRMLGPSHARQALDVGSGTGTLASRLAAAGWVVTGCEPELTMRAVASRQHPELHFVTGGLPALPFPDASFEAITANFVLNHVDDPRRSAREIVRVAAAGAPLAATIWTVSPSWFWTAVCEAAELAPSSGGRLPEDKDFERTADGFARMLADGGWDDVRVEESTWTWHATPQQLWASVEGGVASAGAFYRSLEGADKQRFRSAFDELIAEHLTGGAVALEHTAALAFGMTA